MTRTTCFFQPQRRGNRPFTETLTGNRGAAFGLRRQSSDDAVACNRACLFIHERLTICRRVHGDAPDASTDMPALSAHAVEILEQMEPNRRYEPSELRGFVPELSMEGLREVMHELWIARQVERFGSSGWRRVRSTCGAHEARGSTNSVNRGASIGESEAPGQNRLVKPEDLFDHDSFSGMFK